jgi:hypothetical protein
MRTDGFFIANDDLFGIDGFRQHFHSEYFTSQTLRCYPGDVPADRERAREVVRYEWTRDGMALSSNDTVAIRDRDGLRPTREFDRVDLLSDRAFPLWTAGILSLIPKEARLERGTFGVNLFRTRTDVVTGPHRDEQPFIIIYVLDKIGGGAETSLHDVDNVDNIVVKEMLNPGQFIIFNDSRFMHSATPLVAPPGGEARRDVLVCTVDSEGTYSQL